MATGIAKNDLVYNFHKKILFFFQSDNNKIYETPTTFQEKLDISENKKHQNDKN